MRLAAVLLIVVASPVVVRSVAAQPVARPVVADSLACTYDACALRVEPGWFSRDLVQGVDGVRVGRFGIIDSDLDEAVAGSDYAVDQAREYDRSHRLALLSGLAGTALLLVSTASAAGGGDERISAAATLGGAVFGLAGIRFQLNAEQALSRAVWEYNRTLPTSGE